MDDEQRRQDETGMEPDERFRKLAKDSAPDDPGGAEAEGHAFKRRAKDDSDDGPGPDDLARSGRVTDDGEDTEGHAKATRF